MRCSFLIISILLITLFVITRDWTKLALIPFIYLCILKGAKEKYIYNPFYIFVFTLASFALYYSDIAPLLISEIPLCTNIFILGCLLSIIIGFGIAKKTVKYSNKIRPGKENFWIVFFIGVFPTALSYFLYGNILDVTENLEEARAKASIPVVNQLMYFLPASIIIACKRDNTKLILIALAFSILSALMTVSKTGLVVVGLFTLIGLDYYRPSIIKTKGVLLLKKTMIVWFPILVVVAFAYNNNKRQDADPNSNLEFIDRGGSRIIKGETNLQENLYLNYLYFCSPWGNLSYNIENNKKKGYGANTFYQFGKKVGYEMEKVEKIEPSFLNTHTFIADYYLDFGYVGAIVFSILLGFIIYFAYVKCCSSGDPLLLSFYSLICFASMMLFFSNHFNNGYILNYFITMVGYYYLTSHIITSSKV